MRLGLSELNLDRCGKHPTDPQRKRAIRGSELAHRLKWALREFDQLSYAYRFPLMASTIRYRLIASKANGKPNLP
jgi:hypothetical protein